VGPAADLPPGFFESVRAGTPPRASSSDSGGVLGADCSAVGDITDVEECNCCAPGPSLPARTLVACLDLWMSTNCTDHPYHRWCCCCVGCMLWCVLPITRHMSLSKLRAFVTDRLLGMCMLQ
jgi:hypothetical protein